MKRNIKTFEEFNFKDAVDSVGSFLTGTVTKKSQKLEYINVQEMKKIISILVNMGYDIYDESGVMTDGAEIWGIRPENEIPIAIKPYYSEPKRWKVGFYFATNPELRNKEKTIIVSDNLEETAKEISRHIDYLLSLHAQGNVFSKPGNIRLGI